MLAFALRLGGALFFPNKFQHDEIFQVLEPAHRLWTGWGIVAWEFREGIRSWLLPAFLSVVMGAAGQLGASPRVYLLAVAALLSLLSLAVVVCGYRVADRRLGGHAGFVVGFICAIWTDLVYFGPKTLTEVIAAHVLVISAYLAEPVTSEDRVERSRLVGIGALLGLVFVLRFHLSLVLLLVAVWTCRVQVRERWLWLIAGALVPVLIGGAVDFATLGTPFQSVWKNIWINVVEGKSNIYGEESVFWYVTQTYQTWKIGIVPIFICFLIGARVSPLFALCAVAVWATHMPLAHKEMRFIYPSTPFIIIVAGMGSMVIVRWAKERYPRLGEGRLVLAVLGAWVALSALENATWVYRRNWTEGTNLFRAEWAAHGKPDLCGIGLVGIEWFAGGYTHLHRPVPMYIYNQPYFGPHIETLDARQTGAFNYALTTGRKPLSPEFAIEQCWGGVCLQRRAGACVPTPEFEVNTVLQKYGN
jgi:hypothetical protein